jgi:HEAT repeat protein
VLEPGIAEYRFWRDFDEHNIREGPPDERDFVQMTDDERGRVEAELLKRLIAKPEDDSWVITALGVLRSSCAAPLLRSLFSGRCSRYTGVAAAEALWRISNDALAVAYLVRVLRERTRLRRIVAGAGALDVLFLNGPRIDAARALGFIDTPESRGALNDALVDRSPEVCRRARAALDRLNGES